eukprot:TRINITY_DN43057_c0_g1_i1.p1 TRINITY_DN43057_c0_g1~~TRINITY_DN43057_c0_g1_i1.p1  ORF type:complete len:178 (+),score=47.39 TRINITY_DN43057_c0_g1_i1:23-535(+)
MAMERSSGYHDCIQATLTACLCLQNWPNQLVERHNKPEVEAQTSPELLLKPILIAKDPNEKVLIETSINSVRVSVCVKKSDELEKVLAARFFAFLQQRAERFLVLRRKPIEGYDLSFLITNDHTETMLKHKLIDFIIDFLKQIDAEIKEQKMGVNARLRLCAKQYLTAFN